MMAPQELLWLAWMARYLPLANFPSEPTPVTTAEERVIRQACLFGLTDKRRLDGVVERREWERAQRREVA